MAAANFDDVIFSATLRPHRSLDRRGFILVIGALAALSFTTGFYFWWVGAWPVIGFMGLDVLAVALAFRLNQRAARAFEEIEVSRSEIVVRRVTASGRRQEFRFNPYWVRLELERADEEGIIRIALRSRERRVAVGNFLNPEDRSSFAIAFGAALAEARS